MSDKEEDKKQVDPEEDEGEEDEEDEEEEEGSEEEEEGDSDSEFDDPPGYVDEITDEGASLTQELTRSQWLCYKNVKFGSQALIVGLVIERMIVWNWN